MSHSRSRSTSHTAISLNTGNIRRHWRTSSSGFNITDWTQNNDDVDTQANTEAVHVIQQETRPVLVFLHFGDQNRNIGEDSEVEAQYNLDDFDGRSLPSTIDTNSYAELEQYSSEDKMAKLKNVIYAATKGFKKFGSKTKIKFKKFAKLFKKAKKHADGQNSNQVDEQPVQQPVPIITRNNSWAFSQNSILDDSESLIDSETQTAFTKLSRQPRAPPGRGPWDPFAGTSLLNPFRCNPADGTLGGPLSFEPSNLPLNPDPERRRKEEQLKKQAEEKKRQQEHAKKMVGIVKMLTTTNEPIELESEGEDEVDEHPHGKAGSRALTPSKTMPHGFFFGSRSPPPEKATDSMPSPPPADLREQRPRAPSVDDVMLPRTSNTQKRRNRNAVCLPSVDGASSGLAEMGRDGQMHFKAWGDREASEANARSSAQAVPSGTYLQTPQQTYGFSGDSIQQTPHHACGERSNSIQQQAPLGSVQQTPGQPYGYGNASDSGDANLPSTRSNGQDDVELPQLPGARGNDQDRSSYFQAEAVTSPQLSTLPPNEGTRQDVRSSFTQAQMDTPTRHPRAAIPTGRGSGQGQAYGLSHLPCAFQRAPSGMSHAMDLDSRLDSSFSQAQANTPTPAGRGGPSRKGKKVERRN